MEFNYYVLYIYFLIVVYIKGKTEARTNLGNICPRFHGSQ